jgi:anaerobic magnesium-protoporphyrin IX monomethyl ester cyclase
LILQHPNRLGTDFVQLGLSEKDIYKHTLIEKLSFDLDKYFAEGKIEKKDTTILTYFDSINEKSSIFT